jgi:hypothetical protein
VSHDEKCSRCDGRGRIAVIRGAFPVPDAQMCPICGGTGYVQSYATVRSSSNRSTKSERKSAPRDNSTPSTSWWSSTPTPKPANTKTSSGRSGPSYPMNWTVAFVAGLVIAALLNERPGIDGEGALVMGAIGGLIVGKTYRQLLVVAVVGFAIYLFAQS